MLNKFLNNENGAAAIEYVLILGIISMVLIAALSPLQKQLLGVVSKTTTLVSNNAKAMDESTKA